jgi:thioredoxin-like negative regulator of GroEL|tara:strand:- start:126 stop:377 length:252 start_codon:yes stop_codon:yes gene_type:complete
MNKLIYVSATWCGPCRQFGPTMDRVASSGIPVQKMDADDDQKSLIQYGIRSVPTVIKVNAIGEEISRISGARSEQEIVEFYNK